MGCGTWGADMGQRSKGQPMGHGSGMGNPTLWHRLVPLVLEEIHCRLFLLGIAPLLALAKQMTGGNAGAAGGCVAQRHHFGALFSAGTPTVGTEAQLCQFCGSAWRHGAIPEPKQWPDPMGRGLSRDKASPSLPQSCTRRHCRATLIYCTRAFAALYWGVCSYSTRVSDNPTQESFRSFSN